ncbi:MAG: SDR family oxidoreductase [bacterium]|nr:SDR family oxidoreductase [bacterium]
MVLITGAGAGIGRALAGELIERGHIVYGGVRNMKRARAELAPLIERPEFRLLELDVNRPAHIERGVLRIHKECGRVDVLINNAGYGLYGAFEELPEAEFRAQLETNLFGAMRMARAVLPGMRERGHGRILNVSSILGRIVVPTGSAYTASKWALEAFSESLRYEVLPFGIYTSLIEPGLIRTNFKQNMQMIAGPQKAARKSTAKQKPAGKQTPPASPYSFLTAHIGRDYDGFSTGAQSAARTIANITERRRPAVRYRVGLDSHGYNFLRWLLPEIVFDALLRTAVFFMARKQPPAAAGSAPDSSSAPRSAGKT